MSGSANIHEDFALSRAPGLPIRWLRGNNQRTETDEKRTKDAGGADTGGASGLGAVGPESGTARSRGRTQCAGNRDNEMNTKHTDECRRVFSRYDAQCPRCRELIDGAPARHGLPPRRTAMVPRDTPDRPGVPKTACGRARGLVCWSINWEQVTCRPCRRIQALDLLGLSIQPGPLGADR